MWYLVARQGPRGRDRTPLKRRPVKEGAQHPAPAPAERDGAEPEKEKQPEKERQPEKEKQESCIHALQAVPNKCTLLTEDSLKYSFMVHQCLGLKCVQKP